ncbi:4'-phosphopantetheinyl transferase superfamily protein [Geitlerinema sp. PCC 9228]|jgi:4'-phosphopantetheinyl transferase|uniref:4'-phosphopantetheinyl transferase family protein n=1 Tax=Geitlerinema sp. PCC 9228 TaxID=111611 RepID=UPI0008F9DA7F|nr:4'-phosphopantetheinyl transferase superfamily protein [Geitlerinema sp. PCC 9228]
MSSQGFGNNFPKGTVCIWQIPLSESVDVTPYLSVLSVAERQKANRFRFQRDRCFYVLAHAGLRYILADYLQLPAAEIPFEEGERGKPKLAGGWEATGIQFNLSHTQNLALVAVAYDTPVGVDVEKVRPVKNLQRLSERFFCPGEAEAIAQFPFPQQQQAFFEIWTCKEAYLKGIGCGLAGAWHRVEVSVAPHQPPQIHRLDGVSPAASPWQVQAVSLPAGYVGALAICDRCCSDATYCALDVQLNPLPATSPVPKVSPASDAYPPHWS